MLQSPTSLFPDPSFRLQALVHGRTYLSSPTAHHSGHQQPGGTIDLSQYRAAGLMYQSHHRLPPFSLAIPPGDILPQYQSHVVASPFSTQPGGFHPGLVSSVRRASFQGAPQPPSQPQPMESYSQTLFNLSHQTHHHHPQALPHSVGPLSLQHSSSVRPSLRAGPSASGGQSEEGGVNQDRAESSFSLRAMPNYFEAVACEGRLSGRGPVRELPLRPVGVSSQRVRHQPAQTKQHLVAAEDATVPHTHHSYQPQHLPHHNHQHQQQHHHHLLPRLPPRISTTTTPTGRGTTPTHNNNNNNTYDDNNDKDAAKLLLPAHEETPHSWKSPTLTSDDLSSEVEFPFKAPNAVHPHPSDRPPLRANPTRYSSNPGLTSTSGGVGSPSGCHSTHSPSSFSVHQRESGSPSTSSSSSPSYHRHFLRGSVIQLASGQLKRVEDLRTEDFLDSCGISAEHLSVDMSRVTHVRMNHDTGCVIIGFAVGKKQIQSRLSLFHGVGLWPQCVEGVERQHMALIKQDSCKEVPVHLSTYKVTVEAIVDHPFFVFNRGWSSCCPSKTLDRYGLPCHQLIVGDVCISLTHRYPNSPNPSSSPPSAISKPPLTPDHKGAAERGPSISSIPQGGPLLATVDPCPLATPTGSRSPPSQAEKAPHVTIPEVVAPTNGHSSAGQGGRAGVSRKRRWSAPDDAERESSPTPNAASRIPFNVALSSLPSAAF